MERVTKAFTFSAAYQDVGHKDSSLSRDAQASHSTVTTSSFSGSTPKYFQRERLWLRET